MSDSKSDSKPPHHTPEQVVEAARVIAENISGEHALPADYEVDQPDGRQAAPAAQAPLEKKRVPIGWLWTALGILAGAAGGIFAGGAVWGAAKESVSQAAAKADAAAVAVATVAKQAEALPVLQQRADAGDKQIADH